MSLMFVGERIDDAKSGYLADISAREINTREIPVNKER